MSVEIKGRSYYRTSEAARMAGISRSTLLRWIDGRVFTDDFQRDRRGWRMFTHTDIARLRREAEKLR